MSSNGGLPELVEDGITGYISVPADVDDLARKMRQTDELPEEMVLEMSKQAIQRAKETFDAEAYYWKLIKIYYELRG